MGTVEAMPGCLGHTNRFSKLLILGHGNLTNFDYDGTLFSSIELAEYLTELCGLKEIGLISFKSCELGAGNFLESFLATLIDRGVRVGWIKGYREPLLVSRNPSLGKFFNETEWNVFVDSKKDFLVKTGKTVLTEMEQKHLVARVPKVKNSQRVKIIKGNINVSPILYSSRYVL